MVQFILAVSAIALIVWTYAGYPLLQRMFPGKQVMKQQPPAQWPKVSVVFAAYNEVEVIEAKIRSIFETNYPKDKLDVWIGSDLSNDGQDEVIAALQGEFPALHLHINTVRSGKSATMNSLVDRIDSDIIVATDANIMFTPSTLEGLVWPIVQGFGATAGHLTYNTQESLEGTAQFETSYLNIENQIKTAESAKYGFCLGMEGGLYAIKRSLWEPIPPHTFMEDFFQTMQLIARGERISFNPEALGLEDVSTSSSEEYKRKIRISMGNWQNLARFWPLLLKRPYPLGFAFLSHKVLRWFTPHLYLFSIIVGLFSPFPLLFVSFAVLPLLTYLLSRLGGRKENALGYFYQMNAALLVGYFRYLGGIKSSVWQPTKRNQQ